MRKVLTGVILAVLLGMVGLASATQVSLTAVPGPVVNAPNELDTVWPDSLYYWIDDLGYYLPADNQWMGTRFTCPADFQLQGVRWYISNPNDYTVDAEVWVYTNDPNGANGGDPLDPIGGGPIWTFSGTQASDWVEIVLDPNDYIDFNAGDEFWLIVGESMAASGYWYPIMCWNPDAPDRTKISTTGVGEGYLYYGSYAQFITAEGETGSFWDLKVVSVYNDLDKFFFEAGTDVQLTTHIENIGGELSGAVDARFVVVDGGGNEVYNQVATVGALHGGQGTMIDAPTLWSPATNDYYYVTVTLEGANMVDDADASNNSYMLLQGVVDAAGDWYRYDDGTFENGVNYGGDGGVATAFKPATLPITCDQASWYITGDQAVSDLQAWRLKDNMIEQLWTYTGAVVDGWNEFTIFDQSGPAPIDIEHNDEMIILAQVNTDYAIYHDGNTPIAGANPDMHDVSLSVADGGATMTWSTGGNYPMRLHASAITPLLGYINIIPVDPPIILTAGEAGSFDYYIEITNNTANGQNVYYWTRAITPNGPTGPLTNRQGFVGAGATVTFGPYTQNVPPTVAAGTYGYEANLHIAPPPASYTSDEMTVFILEPIAGFSGGNYDWSAAADASVDAVSLIPAEYTMDEAYPNPFNPTTNVSVSLPEAAQLKVVVFNSLGQQVAELANGRYAEGYHTLTFNGQSLSSGIYFIQATVPGKMNEMRKVVLMK